MAFLSLRNLTKKFDGKAAVRGASLEISRGEFFSILGPSGCGKTTLLRMIAGFEFPTSGSIVLNGEDVTSRPAQDRGIGMVFQNYALFPHMTVFQNVAFGLQTQHRAAKEIAGRVEKILESVRLTEKTGLPVTTLSGGEQQRVAVARALVVEPAVLLLDEPLSNLDVALRLQTREEIRSLQRKTGITTVYVTHDQSEAMSLSDRIAVMDAGSIEQVGTPSAVYESPVSPFVARFLGGANILRVGGSVAIPPELLARGGDGMEVAVKPECITLQDGPGRPTCVIEEKEYLGFTTNFVIRISSDLVRATMVSSELSRALNPGDEVGFVIDWSRSTTFHGGGS
jgi:ABC-type Fe3+/spermidine/putrescine transport system ATPase subunit